MPPKYLWSLNHVLGPYGYGEHPGSTDLNLFARRFIDQVDDYEARCSKGTAVGEPARIVGVIAVAWMLMLTEEQFDLLKREG